MLKSWLYMYYMSPCNAMSESIRGVGNPKRVVKSVLEDLAGHIGFTVLITTVMEHVLPI